MKRPGIVVVDYGMGNLRSVSKALEALGGRVSITSSPEAVRRADGVVLPGVGAFGEAVVRLKRLSLFEPLRRRIAAGRPFLGICLGLQLLFDKSREFGRHSGMACLRGCVVGFPRGMVVPHMGWNRLAVRPGTRLFRGLPRNPFMYFVHSYHAVPVDAGVVAARTTYGRPFVSAVETGLVTGVQFHPEKSQRGGLRVLSNFLEMAGNGGR